MAHRPPSSSSSPRFNGDHSYASPAHPKVSTEDDLPTLTLELGGTLENLVYVLASDGTLGTRHQSDVAHICVPGGEMDKVCAEVTQFLDSTDQFVVPKVLIAAGGLNLLINSKTIGGRMPLRYLLRNWSIIKLSTVKSVIQPLSEVADRVQRRGGLMMVASVILPYASFSLKERLYVRLLSECHKEINRVIHVQNHSRRGKTFCLAEKFHVRKSISGILRRGFHAEDGYNLKPAHQPHFMGKCINMLKSL